MRINESTFRKILREEARRTLREADAVQTASGGTAAPVQGTPAITGVMAGPVPAGPTDAALKSVKAASGALKSTIAKIDIARDQGAPASKSLVNLLTAISYIPDSSSSAPFPAPTDPKFVGALERVQKAQAGLAKTAETDPVASAILLLASGDSGRDWGNWNDATSYFVSTYRPAAADLQVVASKGTLSNADAAKFVAAVRPSGANLVQQWKAFIAAMNEYKRASTQTNLGFSVAPTATSIQYSVVKGDTVAAIAQKFYGIAPSRAAMPTYQTLVGQGSNPNVINVGQKLSLPKTINSGGKDYIRKDPAV